MKRFALFFLMGCLYLMPRVCLASHDAVFALIITNNRSYSNARPDLQYADDDGARYYSFFRMVATESNVTLLTGFDEPTRRLYPDLERRTGRPTRAELDLAIRRLKGLVARAKTEKMRTVFYLVFAGHRHVDKGKGF